MTAPLRRVLFLTYYFPPSGGPGVQRALKFAKYFPEFGWQPTVLTVNPEDASYPDRDESLLDEIPPDVRVEPTRAWDPYAVYARLLGKTKSETVGVGSFGESGKSWKQQVAKWVRANLFIPDARVGWVPFAVNKGREILRATPHDALLTTGPPHSTHLAGLMLSRQFNLPWVADFRDPWTDIDFAHQLPTTWLARTVDAALERKVLRRASAVTVVSPTWKRGLEERVPGRYQVIWNGFDPADFPSAEAGEQQEQFYITYVGSLNAARNPEALWQALRTLGAPSQMPELRVRFIGSVDPSVLARAQSLGLESIIQIQPYVPHAEAVREMQQSSILLLLINDVPNQQGIIPGKVYEYLAAARPVLAIGPPAGDSAAVLSRTGGGQMIGYEDVEGVRAYVERHYAAWRAGAPLQGASRAAALQFSRRSQTGELALLLDELVKE
jgi:glycosyltransferase involved in cell wall biosynthesis